MTDDELLAKLRGLQEGYNAARRSGGSPEAAARAVWAVLRPWNDAQAGLRSACFRGLVESWGFEEARRAAGQRAHCRQS